MKGILKKENMTVKELLSQANKIKYVGDFKDGVFHGNGTVYRPDGTEDRKGKFVKGDFQEK